MKSRKERGKKRRSRRWQVQKLNMHTWSVTTVPQPRRITPGSRGLKQSATETPRPSCSGGENWIVWSSYEGVESEVGGGGGWVPTISECSLIVIVS